MQSREVFPRLCLRCSDTLRDGNLVFAFLFLYVLLMKLYDIVVEMDLLGFYDEACVPRLLCYCIYSRAKL